MVYTTFQEAYQMLGLLRDDSERRKLLLGGFKTSFRPLTEFLSLIIFYCQPASPRALCFDRKDTFIANLWNKFWHHPELCNEKLGPQYIFAEIQESRKTLGNSTIAQFGLPSVDPNLPSLLRPHHEGPSELLRKGEEDISKLDPQATQHN